MSSRQPAAPIAVLPAAARQVNYDSQPTPHRRCRPTMSSPTI